MEELKASGESADRLVEAPLGDPLAQELRTAAERRLDERSWKMPPFWTQIALDFTNLQPDVGDEEDGWAFIDALAAGFLVREIEAARPDSRPIPDDVRVRLARAAEDDRAEVALRSAVDLAASRLQELTLLGPQAWDELEFWARMWAVAQSRGRRRERLNAAGVDDIAAVPSLVDYNLAFTFGYALRSCQEASDFDDLPATQLSNGPLLHESLDDEADGSGDQDAFHPDDHDGVDVRASAEALLMATEEIFVGIRAPSRVGAAINQVALTGQGADPDSPQFGAASGAVLFGYALRMACAGAAPLSEDEFDEVEICCHLLPDGGFDYEEMGEDADALGELLEYAGELADGETRLLTVLRVPFGVWDELCGLVAGQLTRNLRRNGLRKRYVPSHESIVNLLRLGVAVRVIDEVAGEMPLTVADLDHL